MTNSFDEQPNSPQPDPEPRPATGGIPFTITQKMKAELTARGFTHAQIHNMTPEQVRLSLGGCPAEAASQEPTNSEASKPKNGRWERLEVEGPEALKNFLSRVVPWPVDDEPGYISLHWHLPGQPFLGRSFRSIDEFIKIANEFARSKKSNLYFCLSRQALEAVRNQENALAFRSIWLDIDIKLKGYPTIEAAIEALFDFIRHHDLPPPSAIVLSGGGMHVYWFSDRPLSYAEWHPYAEGLKAAALRWGLRCDAGLMANGACVLRVPGTANFKTNPPKSVRLYHLMADDIDFSKAFAPLKEIAPATGKTARTKVANPRPGFNGAKASAAFAHLDPGSGLGEGIEDYPLLPFPPIKEGCAWLREAHDTGGKGHDNPQWHLAVLSATFMEDGHALAHAFGNKHPDYTLEETEEKWDEKIRARAANPKLGWPSCKAIQDAGSKHCKSCPHFAAEESPLHLALQPDPRAEGVTVADFRAYLPDHSYIFTPTGAFWSMAGVNACLRRGTAKWIDRNQPVHHLTWAPGHPMLIENQLVIDGGWVERNGVTTFNLYRGPSLKHGDPSKAGPWLELVHKVYPEDAGRLIPCLAHRVRRPGEKINHAVVLGGTPGIGKDTILEPVKRAVGAWNFKETSPQQILGRFNGFLQSVIMRISEVRDLGEFNRYQFYEHTKAYFAAPPDTLRVDEKNIPEHDIMNCTFAILTTNRLTDGIFLPPDDRRHDVMWSGLTKDDFTEAYWIGIWNWYNTGGDSHVAAYLASLDISGFDPKAPPPKTAAFWAIVDANRAPEEGELQDLLDKLDNPDAVTLDQLINAALGIFTRDQSGKGAPFGRGLSAKNTDLWNWLNDRKNRRSIPHRLDAAGYVPVRNEARETGLWVIAGVRRVVYAKKSLSLRDQLAAVTALQEGEALATRVEELLNHPLPGADTE